MNPKRFAPILILLIAALELAAGGIWYYEAHQPANQVSVGNNVSGAFSAVTGVTTTTSAVWGTFTNPEDKYSIQYPDPAHLLVQYTAAPRRTILGWVSKPEYDVEIYRYDDFDNLSPTDWLATSTAEAASPVNLTLEGMIWVVYNSSSSYEITAYHKDQLDGLPFIFKIEFVCYLHGPCSPPFWRQMLSSFRIFPDAISN